MRDIRFEPKVGDTFSSKRYGHCLTVVDVDYADPIPATDKHPEIPILRRVRYGVSGIDGKYKFEPCWVDMFTWFLLESDCELFERGVCK